MQAVVASPLLLAPLFWDPGTLLLDVRATAPAPWGLASPRCAHGRRPLTGTGGVLLRRPYLSLAGEGVGPTGVGTGNLKNTSTS